MRTPRTRHGRSAKVQAPSGNGGGIGGGIGFNNPSWRQLQQQILDAFNASGG